MQLRQKLFLVLSLMAMVPLLVLLFGVVGHVERDLEKRAGTELQKTLAKMSQEITNLLDYQKSIAEGLVKVPVVQEFARMLANQENEQFEDKATDLMAFFLNYQSTVPSIQAIRFTDTEGRTLVKVKEGKLVTEKFTDDKGRTFIEDISYKPFFQRAVKTTDRISISDFERGKVSGEVDFCPAMVRYSAPIRDELESNQGVLVVNMWGRQVDDLVETALGGFPGNAYIAELNPEDPERDGIYLYHQEADKRFSNQMGTSFRFSADVGEQTWQQIHQQGMKGLIKGDDGRMWFYRKLSPYPDRRTQWLLVIETSMDTILAPVSGLRQWIGFLIFAVIIVSVLVARWAAARLSAPVHELAQIITHYADGEKGIRYQDTRRDEIGAAGRAFNYLSENLERAEQERDKAEQAARQSERLAAVGQMAAGIGHEINNPLMNIMSLANLIETSVPDEDRQAKDDMRALINEGKRCARIVSGILNFARENEPCVETFDFARLIEDTIVVFKHRMETSHIRLHMDVEQPLMIDGDANQLQQVLVNVVLNAIHVSPTGANLYLKTRIDGNELTVEVLDEGPGISKEDLPRVFSPFFTTKPSGTGTGLGLSVSYGIVKKHGGTIVIENRDPKGVRVLIRLPVRNPALRLSQPQDKEISKVG